MQKPNDKKRTTHTPARPLDTTELDKISGGLPPWYIVKEARYPLG